jgi:hypothetical protein
MAEREATRNKTKPNPEELRCGYCGILQTNNQSILDTVQLNYRKSFFLTLATTATTPAAPATTPLPRPTADGQGCTIAAAVFATVAAPGASRAAEAPAWPTVGYAGPRCARTDPPPI